MIYLILSMMMLVIFEVKGMIMKFSYNGRCNLSGIRIKEMRLNEHISQEALAARLQLLGMEITQKAISRIECGLRVVPDYELKYFAQVFHKPVEWFLEE